MIKELIHDPIFLAGKSEIAMKEDLQVPVSMEPHVHPFNNSLVGAWWADAGCARYRKQSCSLSMWDLKAGDRDQCETNTQWYIMINSGKC